MRNIDFISASSSSRFHTRTSLLNTMKSISVSRELFRFRFYFSDWRLVEDGNITWRNGRRSGDKPRYYRKSAPRKRVFNFISIPGCRKTPSEKMNMHFCSWPSKSCGKCFRSCRHSLLLGGSKNNANVPPNRNPSSERSEWIFRLVCSCLLYTSDAADD